MTDDAFLDNGVFKGTLDSASLAHLFACHGQRRYSGPREEPVTALAHALQCAGLAEDSGASRELVLAALLHDIGHLVMRKSSVAPDMDDRHETIGANLLGRVFGPAVAEPVRLHVSAKRYLCAVQRHYVTTLSPASVHSLALQGGPMSEREADEFARLPFATEAIRLRTWDDQAKLPGQPSRSLGHFLAMIGH